jgi:sigma-B regulation protein RsbU (phosphoserine phosphatase)
MLINGECGFIEVDTGLPLGFGVSAYPEHAVTLPPGARLLLYSDGITEAMNGEYEEYGPARLIDHFLQPGACAQNLLERVRAFELGSNTADDATAVVINSR